MDTDEPKDPAMLRVLAWWEGHRGKVSLHELGLKMGYSEDVARKAVHQFLKSKDPRVGMLRRFAKAAGMSIQELVDERKEPARRKK
jgi:hypothetical protein